LADAGPLHHDDTKSHRDSRVAPPFKSTAMLDPIRWMMATATTINEDCQDWTLWCTGNG
jgi:hypothetical protein